MADLFDLGTNQLSLAGNKGRVLKVESGGAITVTDAGIQVLASNSRRLYALIKNSSNRSGGTPQDLSVSLGPGGGAGVNYLILNPGDVLIIDRDHPWTGEIVAGTASGITSEVNWLDVSVIE